MNSRKFYIQTFGCQMNSYDSERIAHLLAARDWHPVDDPARADLIFVNTCSVREKPEKKVYSALGRFRALKKRNPQLLIGVGGCVAQQEGEKLLERIPHLDFVLGTKELKGITRILDLREGGGPRSCATSLEGRVDPYDGLPLFPPAGKATAFVSIMQGCDNFCSFCIVPFVRGREVSRPSRDILEEIQSLCAAGVKEVTLLGQNVNSYGKGVPGEMSFPELLSAVDQVRGVERIRFTTSHPKDLSSPMVRSFGRLSKLCEHIHLPLQSGSDRILAGMKRGYSREEYLDKISALRRACPEIAITTDMIVGFPGEEEKDFRETLEMMERVRFDDLFSFAYSDRPPALASSLGNKVPEGVKRERLAALQSLQRRITEEKNRAWEGKVVEVLVEGPSKAGGAEKTGRTRTNRIVNFPGASIPAGSLVKVRIEKALAHSLRGKIEEK